eukprot:evm.model.scf_18.28 EVM.evm.TU.scf_18.28   scf_18:179151-179806(-)
MGAIRRGMAAMAKPTKISEFRGMSAEEIDAEVEKCQRALYDLRVKKYTGQPFKSHEFRWYRRKVAQLLTERRAQEIGEGIGKRESRKAEKARMLEKGLWVRVGGDGREIANALDEMEVGAALFDLAGGGGRSRGRPAAREPGGR